jgi:hypothetical protein
MGLTLPAGAIRPTFKPDLWTRIGGPAGRGGSPEVHLDFGCCHMDHTVYQSLVPLFCMLLDMEHFKYYRYMCSRQV